MGFWDRWSKLFGAEPKEGPRKTGKLLFILLAVGLALLLFNSFFNFSREKDVETPPGENVRESAGESADPSPDDRLSSSLAGVLAQIRGVSEVEVFLTPGASGRTELVADREKSLRKTSEGDGGGGAREIVEETERKTHVIMRDPQGNEAPLVVEEGAPRYRGVLVVAKGVEDDEIKASVVEALQVLLGLPAHRITVLPRQ